MGVKKTTPFVLGDNPISGIGVAGYKSIIHEQSIQFKPLTILAGANCSGKSSMIQPLLLLKQTLEDPLQTGDLKIDGPNVSFSKVDQLFSRTHGGGSDQLAFRIDYSDKSSVTLQFKSASSATDRKKKDVLLVGNLIKEDDISFFLSVNDLGRNLKAVKLLPPKLFEIYHWPENIQCSIMKYKFFVFPSVSIEQGKRSYIWSTRTDEWFLSKIVHLPGYRGNRERSYPATETSGEYKATFHQYTGSVISKWQREQTDKYQRLGDTLRDLELTWNVKAEYIDDTRVEIKVGRGSKTKLGGPRDLVNIADVGFGVSQVLPILVALIEASPGQIVYIEEPEIHLHPNAQYKMAKVLADAAKRGVIVIAETHSPIIIRRIQTLVAEGYIGLDQVGMYWFERDPKDGATNVTEAELDANGAYGDWPQDFDDVTLRVEKEYLDAVSRRRRRASR